MPTEDRHRLGYQRVDDDPNVDVLLATMDETAGWDATLRLRSWERAQLELGPGQRLLDVGCGLGEAALALAPDLGDSGEIVGIDASERMLRVARSSAGCRTVVACASPSVMPMPSTSPTIPSTPCGPNGRSSGSPTPQPRSPRWCVSLRPGGRISLIDTDWSTFTIDVGDDALAALVRDGMRTERHRPSNVGRRLHDLVRAAGCDSAREHEATQTWTTWDPDESPAPPGASPWRASPTTSSRSIVLATADRESVRRRPSTRPRGEVSSRCASRCSRSSRRPRSGRVGLVSPTRWPTHARPSVVASSRHDDPIPRPPARHQRRWPEQGADGGSARPPRIARPYERLHLHRQRQRDPELRSLRGMRSSESSRTRCPRPSSSTAS